jgi:TatD DNase family protein
VNPQPPVQKTASAVDTHCHLFLMDEEPQDAVESARAAGVETLVCVGIDPRSSHISVGFAETFEGVVFATAGLHPHEASDLDSEARADIEALAANPLVVGIGETGLDFFRMLAPRQDQESALRFHAAVSRDVGKPLVVHVRDAWERALEVLDEERMDQVVLHCFSGDETIATECIERGYFLSFAGPITYPKNESLRAAARAIPAGRILTETDSPHLPPQHLRGKSNIPANVHAVVECLAEARGEDIENVARTTSENARTVFSGL